MPKYEDWLLDFLCEKNEVLAPAPSDKFAVHSIRRFLEGKNHIWEIGTTYTGRLVVRLGQIGADGTSVVWQDWVTHHDVEMPRNGV